MIVPVPLAFFSRKPSFLGGSIHQLGAGPILLLPFEDGDGIVGDVPDYVPLLPPLLIEFVDLVVRLLLLEPLEQLGVLNLYFLELLLPESHVKTFGYFLAGDETRPASSPLAPAPCGHNARDLLEEDPVFPLDLGEPVLEQLLSLLIVNGGLGGIVDGCGDRTQLLQMLQVGVPVPLLLASLDVLV